MIKIEQLYFGYVSGAPVFADFNWNVAPAERWSVIGPSGCGKTTLLYMLAGLRIPASGRINIGGRSLLSPRLSTGLILQSYGLLPWATALDNVTLGLKIRRLNNGEINRVSMEWLTNLGVSDVSDRYSVELSGGQQQRVAIARTLALNPDLLLMDEPFGSLDAITREEMQNLVLELWESFSSTMVLVTHNIEEAVFLGKKIMILTRPPNGTPTIIDNNKSGYIKYRDTTDFVEKCEEIRKLVEKGNGRTSVGKIKVN